MAEATRTDGEKLFELYLATQGIPFEFEKEYKGKAKRPDYTIAWNSEPVVFDVKDFIAKPLKAGFSQIDPYGGIREKIIAGRKKFKEFKEFTCGLVLCNLGNFSVNLQFPDFVLGAMYGDSGFTFPVNTTTGEGDANRLTRAFLGNGRMIQPHWSKPENTTLSALITVTTFRPYYLTLLQIAEDNRGMSFEDIDQQLREELEGYDLELELPRFIVWHNGVARIPFPDDLFRGPVDTHFGLTTDEAGVLHQGCTYRGAGLPDRIKV